MVLTCMYGILLVEMEVGVDVGMLMMMRCHIKHLQPGQRVIAESSHPLSMLALSCQALGIGHVGTKGRAGCQRQPLPLQVAQPWVERKSGMKAGSCLQTQPAVAWERIHGSSWHGVELLQLGWLDFKAGLETFTQVPVPQVSFTGFPLPQLPLPRRWITAVDGWDVVSQQAWVNRTKRHIERVVAVAGGHDMGPGIFAEGAQSWGVRTQVWGNSRYGTALLKRGAVGDWSQG